MIILNILMSILILVVIPACIGLLVVMNIVPRERSLGLIIPMGYMVMLLLFELVTVPVLMTTQYQNFKYVCFIYTPVMLVLAVMGLFAAYQRAGSVYEIKNLFLNMTYKYIPVRDDDEDKWNKLERIIIWSIVGAVLVFILIMAETQVIFDGDDAYYVVQSLISQQNGSMYVTLPYTGGASPIDMRHAMAAFPMWISYVGKMTGIHSTIVCHTVLPLVLIPLSIIIFSEIGIRLLKNKEEMLPYFILFTELLILFGRVSIYTSETFMVSRTWQGKSVAANILLPMVILSLLLLFNRAGKGSFLVILILDAVAGIFSSLAVVLVSIIIFAGGVWHAIYTKKIAALIRICICLIPGMVYMVMYILFRYRG